MGAFGTASDGVRVRVGFWAPRVLGRRGLNYHGGRHAAACTGCGEPTTCRMRAVPLCPTCAKAAR